MLDGTHFIEHVRAPASPLVSIIVPFYRQADFLLEAVRSIEAQTYRNLEVVVVDDCSPDVTAAEMLSDRTRVNATVLRHSKNRGAGAARNTGIREARGDLIVPLDADDILMPTYVEESVNLLNTEPGSGGVYTDVDVFGRANFLWVCECGLPKRLTYGGPNTFLYRRAVWESVGGYKEDWRFGEDFEFWVAALEAGWSFLHLNKPLYRYRTHPGGKSNGKDWSEVIRKLLRDHKDICLTYLDDLLADKAERLSECTRQFETLKSDYAQLMALKKQYAEDLKQIDQLQRG